MAVKTASPRAAPKAETVPRLSAKIHKLFDDGDKKVKAVASVNIGGAFAVHGVKVIDSDKGLFVSMPSNSYKNGSGETKYQDVFHPVSAESRQQFVDTVLSAYDQALAEQQAEGISEDEDAEFTQSM